MNVIVCKNYEEMSKKAAELFASRIKANKEIKLGLATGSTPVGMYRELIKKYEAGEIDFASVRTFNLDEYYPIEKSNSQSYDYFMKDNLFSKVNVKPENVHIPNGEAKDGEAEAKRYEAELAAAGYPDIQLLGIGQNGHIAFNEPDEALVAVTHVTGLTESTVRANSRFFASEDEVPKHALTMGMGSILKAKEIVLLAGGKEKHAAVAAMLDDKIRVDCPATLLKLHPNVTVFVDEAAYNG